MDDIITEIINVIPWRRGRPSACPPFEMAFPFFLPITPYLPVEVVQDLLERAVKHLHPLNTAEFAPKYEDTWYRSQVTRVIRHTEHLISDKRLVARALRDPKYWRMVRRLKTKYRTLDGRNNLHFYVALVKCYYRYKYWYNLYKQCSCNKQIKISFILTW